MAIIVVWMLLAAVMLAYVVYRLITDRRAVSKRHPLYPLSSNSTDGLFPSKDDHLGRAAYLIILIGLLGFVGIIYAEGTNQTAPIYLIYFVGISITIGMVALGVSKLVRKDNQD